MADDKKAKQPEVKSIPVCSFCGNDAGDAMLVKGADSSHICESCITECDEIVKEHKSRRDLKSGRPVLTPHLIKKHLDEFVVGQDRAKRLISVACYNHFKRINKYDTGGVELQKSNVLLIGPTGCGKTLIAKTLGRLLKVPIAIADATALTQAGYVGDDVESILTRLVQAANGDIALAQKGIVYIDEIDKIARVANDRGRDVAGEGVQQGLLKILEGGIVAINPEGPKKMANTPTAWIDTSDILFIGGGAFSGIFDHRNKKKLGLNLEKDPEDTKLLCAADLVRFGMIPEFVGRLPVIAQLDQLTTDDLIRILRETKHNLVDQYSALFRMDGLKPEFDEAFLKGLAEKATKEGTGARGLRALMERALSDVLFDGPELKDKELKIGSKYLEVLDK